MFDLTYRICAGYTNLFIFIYLNCYRNPYNHPDGPGCFQGNGEYMNCGTDECEGIELFDWTTKC